MTNPYLILGLWEKRNALTDQLVKESYLKLVKKHTPDKSPQRFQQIKQAYEQLKTSKRRLQYSLFDKTLADREDLIMAFLPEKELMRPDIKLVQRILVNK